VPVTSKDRHHHSTTSTIYGHVHIGKTAGTTINGRLANEFERVCGHKGYSYDFTNVNRRQASQQQKGDKKPVNKYEDIYAVTYNTYSRRRVHPSIMEEIGYHNCDYISHETSWQFWRNKGTYIPDHTMELHVPCRDPIDHLLSQCNERHREFYCGTNIRNSVEHCLLSASVSDRFSNNLKTMKGITLKCFNPVPVEDYIQYMSTRLQRKRIPPEPYVHVATNRDREKRQECIWKSPALQDELRTFLIENVEYYNFCHSCIGSKDDILA